LTVSPSFLRRKQAINVESQAAPRWDNGDQLHYLFFYAHAIFNQAAPNRGGIHRPLPDLRAYPKRKDFFSLLANAHSILITKLA
jgi:hypothetical protein